MRVYRQVKDLPRIGVTEPSEELTQVLITTLLSLFPLKPDDRVRPAFDVDTIDESNVFRFAGHHHRVRALAGAEETHAAHQRSIGNSGGREDDLLTGREILGVVNFVRIGDAHRLQALDHFLCQRHLIFVHPETLRRWAHEGMVTYWAIGRGRYMEFDPKDIEALDVSWRRDRKEPPVH